MTRPVPEAVAQIALPLDQLKCLPEGVGVSEVQRQARATVMVKDDTLFLTAHSDSMPREVEECGGRWARQEQEVRRASQQRFFGVGSALMAVLCVVGLLGVLFFLVRR